MVAKGKETASSGGKRKQTGGEEDDKSGRSSKRKISNTSEFIDDEADADDYDGEESEYDDDDFFEESGPSFNDKTGKAQNLPFIPKEEEIDEDFEQLTVEQYNRRLGYVSHTDDSYDMKKLADRDLFLESVKDATIWKVKCMVGREKHSVFCLMQKFVDLKSLGTKLEVISAFSLHHVKGFIFIEAEKQIDVNEACRGISSIYPTKLMPIPQTEVSQLFSTRNSCKEVAEGMWVRVKSGKYKGDLAQIAATNIARKRVTIKLIPRIDLQSLAQKFGGGVSLKKDVMLNPRLISSSDLAEFRPLIQHKFDRETGKMFEVLDGMMLKDGFLYKRVPIDSLNCWNVLPTADELSKFELSMLNESNNMEWLTRIYGEQNKKNIEMEIVSEKMDDKVSEKTGVKGQCSSASSSKNVFELYSFVFFRRRDFGIVVGTEKDGDYKVLKEGPQGQLVVNIKPGDLKKGPSDLKFTALDKNMKPVAVDDTVKILDGPFKDREGIVKHVFKGVIFICDVNETENGGYFCSKARNSQNLKFVSDIFSDKGGKSEKSSFDDFTSSPKSPLSPKRQWEDRETDAINFKQEKDGMFSIGQTLRIRVGPLKGYLCRVTAIRYSDVTVKLDSRQQVLTMKSEHLAEVRGKGPTSSTSDDHDSGSFKPFDLLGSEGGSGGWTGTAGASTDDAGWNNFTDSKPMKHSGDTNNDVTWESEAAPNGTASWGGPNLNANGASSSGWNKSDADTSSDPCDPWGKPDCGHGGDSTSAWDKGKNVVDAPAAGWDAVSIANPETGTWSQPITCGGSVSTWDDTKSCDSDRRAMGSNDGNVNSGWGKEDNTANASQDSGWGPRADVSGAGQGSSWGKSQSVSGAGRPGLSSSWGTGGDASGVGQGSSWGASGDPSAASQSSGWAKKSSDTDVDLDSGWGKKGSDTGSGQDSGWEKKGSDADAGQVSVWGKKGGDTDVGPVSGWGKKGSDADVDPDSGWGKKGTDTDVGPDSGWGKKGSDADVGLGTVWGKKGSDADVGPDTGWGKKGSDADMGPDSVWGKKGSDTDAGQEHGWRNHGNEARGSGGSGWNKKSSWNSQGNDTCQGSSWGNGGDWTSRNDNDQNESYGNRSNGGNWRGGFGGRGDTDRGRGGRRGGRGSRGGFGGRSSYDSGGFGGGRSSDGGGRGWTDRGYGRGRGGSDRGGFRGGDGGGRSFRGRGRSDRGGFRGRGRSDHDGFGDRDGSGDRCPDWKNNANSNSGWKGWSSQDGGNGGFGGWGSTSSEQGNTHDEPKFGSGTADCGVGGGWSGQGSSWKLPENDGTTTYGGGGGGWKGQGSSWKQPANDGATTYGGGGGGWNQSEKDGAATSGGWKGQGSSWKQPEKDEAASSGGWKSQTCSWKQPENDGTATGGGGGGGGWEGQTSSWKTPEKETGGGAGDLDVRASGWKQPDKDGADTIGGGDWSKQGGSSCGGGGWSKQDTSSQDDGWNGCKGLGAQGIGGW